MYITFLSKSHFGGDRKQTLFLFRLYDEAFNKIRDAAKVAKASMIPAGSGVKATDGKDIWPRVDGTWQSRGFSSLNEIVATIAVTNGNVLDVGSEVEAVQVVL